MLYILTIRIAGLLVLVCYFLLGAAADILLVMDTIIFTKKEEEFLKTVGVAAVVLFGSQAQGLARVESDYDLAVITSAGVDETTIYDTLYEIVSAKIDKLVNIDIVFLSDAPLELKNHVAKYGRILYQADLQTFLRFKESVMEEYCDFAPLRREFQRATLARIAI